MEVAGYRSKVIALVIGSIFVAALFLLGNNSGSIEGAGHTVDVEPHYDITATTDLCNSLPGHALPAIGGPSNPACVDDDTPGGPRTSTTIFTIPSGQLNFSSFNTFEPTEVLITPGCNVDRIGPPPAAPDGGVGLPDNRTYTTVSGKLPTDRDGIDNDNDTFTDEDGECLVPGDLVGGMRSNTTLALFNGTCTSPVIVDFAFYNVALPNNPDDPRASTNIAVPDDEGVADRIAVMMKDVLPLIPAPDGLADADSPGILGYPDWFLDLFDPDWRALLPSELGPRNGKGEDPEGINEGYTVDFNGDLKPVIPIAVYGGITNVAGTATPLYYAQFADGFGAVFDESSFFSVAQPGMGQLNMSVLTDTATGQASSSTIADFCSELIARGMFLGTTGNGMTRAINPTVTPQTVFTTYWSTSQRDTDNDSYENQIDTCPTLANIDDIRILAPVGDPDLDRIDSACDVNPGANDGINVDGDVDASGFGFQNAQDNCPQVANDTQEESENKNATTPDGGPKTDGIGDDCDVGSVPPVDPTFQQNGYPISIALSDTVANGNYHLTTIVEPYCYGGTDADGDGYCEEDLDLGRDGDSSMWKTAWGGTGSPVTLSDTTADRDGDGYSDYVESYIGTDPTKACSFSGGLANADDENSSKILGLTSTTPLAVDAWPSDYNDDGIANLQDMIWAYVTNLSAPLDPAPPYGLDQPADPALGWNRLDVKVDGFVDLADVITSFVSPSTVPLGLDNFCPLGGHANQVDETQQ